MNKIIPFLLLFFFISGSFVTAVNSVSASGLVEDSWNTKTPMSQARGGLGVVAVDGKIYAIGGLADDNYMDANEQYDPKTDTWVTLQSMPTPRANFAIIAYQNKIYCLGGETYSGYCVFGQGGLNEVYDIATDSWSTKKSVPFTGSGLQAHVVDGKIFVMHNGNLYLYDPLKDSWTKRTSVPTASAIYVYVSSVSTVIDDKIIFDCLIAMIHGRAQLNRNIMIYEPKINAWRNGQIGTNFVGEVVAAGATTGFHAPKRAYFLCVTYEEQKTTQVYDSMGDVVFSAKSMPTYRKGFGVANIDDVFYAIGGSTSLGACSINEQYVPIDYRSTPIGPKPSDPLVASEPGPSTPSSTYLIVAIFVIIVGTIALGYFSISRKEKGNKLKDMAIWP